MIQKIKLYEDSNSIITLYHGGNLDDFDYKTKNHTKGRSEMGRGLYLTDNKDHVLQQYSKGSRKKYKVELELGNEASDVLIPAEKIEDLQVILSRDAYKKFMERIKKFIEKYEGSVPADIINNTLVNMKLIKASNSADIVDFLVKNGVDYVTDSNHFGWGDTTYTVFNLSKIKNIERIKS